MSITQFTMEEVRCFAERQTLEIRPLTFLVGENSTGKTTALACFHILANFLRGAGVDFNSDPHSMGIFKDIVRNSKPKAKVFKLGFTFKHSNEDVEWIVEFAEKDGGIEPTVSSVNVKFADGEIACKTKDKMDKGVDLTVFNQKQNQYAIDYADGFFSNYSLSLFLDSLVLGVLESRSKAGIALVEYLKKKSKSLGQDKDQPWSTLGYNASVFSASPVRSRPKRTYDPLREFSDPEGSDVPLLLMQSKTIGKDSWEKLKAQLVEFGKKSGLYQNIEIKNLGRGLGAPFQLKFKVRGPNANIVDVGYGVSQILPILAQVLNAGTSQRAPHGSQETAYFLLQQPEVHLHPKAQAELSSLLANLGSQGNRSFIVETHSDYMIDRARIEIRRGNIRPEDVSLIYFEPKGNIVNVHNIHFDKMANMAGVPPHYGEFFLKETDRLMGFED